MALPRARIMRHVQALVLAAGMGRRLAPLTCASPKCMLEVNGQRLVELQLDALVMAGVARVIVVVGHGAAEVRGYLSESWQGVPIRYVYNPEYTRTNNIYSLALAGHHLAERDTILVECDLVFDPQLMVAAAAASEANLALVAPHEPWMDGTVVELDGHGDIARFRLSDELERGDHPPYFKTVNIYKLSRAFSHHVFLPALQAFMRAHGRNAFYEAVLREMTAHGVARLAAFDASPWRWFEIDTAHDLKSARALFAPHSQRLVGAPQQGKW